MLKQVGVIALRSPTGEFLPAVPLMREVPKEKDTEKITQVELEKIFVDRMKQYVNAKGSRRHNSE